MFVRHSLSLFSSLNLHFTLTTKHQKEMTNKGEKESLLKANFKTIYLLTPLAIMVVFWQGFGNLAPKEITFWKNRILACNYLQRNLIPFFLFSPVQFSVIIIPTNSFYRKRNLASVSKLRFNKKCQSLKHNHVSLKTCLESSFFLILSKNLKHKISPA